MEIFIQAVIPTMFLIAPCSIIAFQYFLRYYDQGGELLWSSWKKCNLSVDIFRSWIGWISFNRPFNSHYWINNSKEINWKNGYSSNFLYSKKHVHFRKIDYCHGEINELWSLLSYSSLTHSFVVNENIMILRLILLYTIQNRTISWELRWDSLDVSIHDDSSTPLW